jgi:uncharacterized protein YgiM (DUF1202 family)
VKHYRRAIFLVALIMLGTALGAAAETMFIQAKTAKLRSGKTSLDPVVADLKYGEAVELVRSEGKWLEVQTAAGAKGWIHVTKTSRVRPSGTDDTLASLGRSFRRGESSEVSASAGARGLDKVSETYANRAGIPERYRQAVDRMAAYQIADQEIEDFLKKGELGEYGK